MAKKMLLAPRIKQPGMPGFLLWARRDNPALYASLQREFPAVAEFEQALRQDQGLAGIADILKAVGGSLKKSATSIGKFVAANALPIATVAVPLVVAKKQADVAKAQVRLAQAQQQPMQMAVQYDANGNAYSVPVRQSLSAGERETLEAAGLNHAHLPIQQQNRAIYSVFDWSKSYAGLPAWAWAGIAGGFVVLKILRRR